MSVYGQEDTFRRGEMEMAECGCLSGDLDVRLAREADIGDRDW